MGQCRYCNTTEVEWAEYPEAGWRLMNPNGTVHRCAEYKEAQYKEFAVKHPRKKKSKHGAFLRLYGPKTAPTYAVLVQTREPEQGTPEAMLLEIDAEPRNPMYAHLAR